MTNKFTFFLFLSISLMLILPASAQDPALNHEWTITSPYEHKEFIRNNGQFDDKILSGNRSLGKVLFGCTTGDIQVYFTSKGLCYRWDESVLEAKRERKDKGGEYEEEKRNSKTVPHFMNMLWVNANPDARIHTADSVSWYFTYGDMRDKSGKTSIKASAFKKIIYRDVYPHIDIEYVLPKDSSGIKYSFILRPGANVGDIKMNYSGLKGISKDVYGNAILRSDFGDFTDHAPVTFYDNDRESKIASSYSVKGNEISFQLGEYDKTKTVIIDPWTVIPPAFTGNRKAAYDVEYDLQGNVYAYGGRKPYQVIKYNSGGVQQWIYTTIFVTDYYGDFAVDGKSGSSYIVEAYRQNSCQIIKVNSAGTQLAVFVGNSSMDEYSRIVYNNCINKAIVAGGGVSGTCQAAILDTTLATLTPINVLGAVTPLHDISLLAIDNSSQCYMATTRSFNHPAQFDNILIKCPAATLLPQAYAIPDNHAFNENASVNYTNAPFQSNGINGFNGIAVSAKYVYTYDGQMIQRRNKLTGAFINSATVTATPFLCGGIAVDDCDNIFVGVEKNVIRYDTNFTVLQTTNFTDTVYDVRLAITNKIYACGKNFVSAFKIIGALATCNSLSVSITPSGSCGSGAVTANVSGGVPNYNYLWSPGGQTTATVTGLAPGTYTVIVSDNSCVPKAIEDSIVVSAATFSTTATSTPATCANNNGTASVTVVIGSAPYTYLWSPSGGNSSAATGLSAGTYTVLVTDGTGCTSLNTVSVTIPNAPSLNLTQNNILCNGNANGSATVTVTGGSAPYTYAWSPSGGNSTAATGLSVGTYSAIVTDANGCSQTQTVSITQPPVLTAIATASATSCGINNGSTTVAASGGTGSYTYSWSPSGGNSSMASGLGAGTYTVTVIDGNGCSALASAVVTATGGPSLVLSGQTGVSCNGGNNGTASVSASGGAGPYTYSWSPSGGASASASGLSAGNYTCIVTDATGCTSQLVVNVTQPFAISALTTATATPCGLSNGAANVAVSGGVGPYSYNWLPSGGNNASASGLAGGTYSVIITDASGCTQIATTIINILNGPSANAGPNANIIVGDSTSLNGSGGVSYTWSPSSTLSCVTCQNPVASPTITTTYTLIVTDANGCTDADEVTISVEPISCSNKPNAGSFYLPNAFSPNGDGQNDDFCLIGWDECLTKFSIKIFNRWGELVFESDDRSFCWDGTFNGNELNTAIFAFTAKAVLYNGVKRDLKGNISLIR